jgi:hypothetical protein
MDTEMPDAPTATVHDAATGETITRELTAEEIAALPEPTEPLTGPE